MRKGELVAGLLLAVLIAGGGMFAVRDWVAPAGNNPDGLPNVSTTLTAKTAYDVSRPVALNWSPDAQLVTAQANWPAGSTFAAAETNWSFIFYAPGRSETAFISVVSGRGQLLHTRPVSQQPPAIADLAKWQTDSPAIIAHILSDGGQQFIQQQGQVALSLTLIITEEPPIWQGQLINAQTHATWTIRLSAINGNTLAIQQSE